MNWALKIENADVVKELQEQIALRKEYAGFRLDTRAKVDSSLKNKFCLIMGNEGNGVRKEIQDMCDKNLYIKTSDKVESLNVGVACSILLYELGR